MLLPGVDMLLPGVDMLLPGVDMLLPGWTCYCRGGHAAAGADIFKIKNVLAATPSGGVIVGGCVI